MRGKDYIADNSFVQAKSIVGAENALQCLINDSTVSSFDGRWYDPSWNEIECNTSTSPLICESNGTTNALSLYLTSYNLTEGMFVEGEYTCCLPDSCSDGSSEQIRVRIFGTSKPTHERRTAW